ncbi:hypothetical protein IFM89_012662 [Coptis chinensis]|uniref:Uncharacterized protein n=1 Tax=Coptis chinensis TaxID=261450 RepID=A0A835H7W5_9MAGN|nr:hypothetical protein IFM89_012662 [Coptis chinensis]
MSWKKDGDRFCGGRKSKRKVKCNTKLFQVSSETNHTQQGRYYFLWFNRLEMIALTVLQLDLQLRFTSRGIQVLSNKTWRGRNWKQCSFSRCSDRWRVSQLPVFSKTSVGLASNSSVVIVDWITSGRHEIGESWDFKLYKSTNHIFLEDQPLFLDSKLHYLISEVLLEDGSITGISKAVSAGLSSHCNGQIARGIANLSIFLPKLKEVQIQVKEHVKRMMYEQLYTPTLGCKKRKSFGQTKPDMIASCSAFGPKVLFARSLL